MPDSKEAQFAVAFKARVTELVADLGEHPNNRAKDRFREEVIALVNGTPVYTGEDEPVDEVVAVEAEAEVAVVEGAEKEA